MGLKHPVHTVVGSNTHLPPSFHVSSPLSTPQVWWEKTPLGKKRIKAAKGDDDDGKGKKGKGKKKGKKK